MGCEGDLDGCMGIFCGGYYLGAVGWSRLVVWVFGGGGFCSQCQKRLPSPLPKMSTGVCGFFYPVLVKMYIL